MKKLVLIGGGGHCKSILDSLSKSNEFDEIVITDSLLPAGSKVLGYPVIGNDDCLESLFRTGYFYAFISVGSVTDTSTRRALVGKAKAFGFSFPVIVDKDAIVSDSAVIEEGTFVSKGAIINSDAHIGKHCIINTGVKIEHECEVGDFSHISTGSILCGQASIGSDCLVGAGSVIIQNISVGNCAIVGARSVVLRDIDSNEVCFGVIH